MHNDSSTVDAVAQDTATDQAIMGLLLIDHPGLWSVGEVERELGDRIAVEDGLARLARAGLVHRLDGFVFATRTATTAAAIFEG